MARLVAFGDAHLGRTHLAALRDDQGRNLREEDFLRSFDWAVEETLRQEPDGFVLLGDLFDHARPSYRVFTRVAVGLRKLSDAGLRGVAISGNHDTPRLRGTGSPYATLEEFVPSVTFAWAMEATTADLAGLKVHAVPQTLDVGSFKEELEKAAGALDADATNLLLAHVALTSLPARAYPDINELEVSESEFDKRFDLIVLGHYHVYQKASKRTWYAGSTDSFTFADRPNNKIGPKGLLLVDTEAGKVEHVANPGERPLVTYGIDAGGMGPGELVHAVGLHNAELPGRAIVRVFLNEVDPAAFRQVPMEDFHEAMPAAAYVQVEPDFGAAALAVQGAPTIGTLEQEWAGYIESQDLAGLDRVRVKDLGERFLVEAKGEEP
ncbi:MAG TPA: DNA repair exonuclease [Actinomycetota bacterium]|jgi:DNA repair exonuclease SbcCD nuclease subunit|nr:DNA repair exonuclease [Actinomycetota bacterium]